jgi:hypothetical protein
MLSEGLPAGRGPGAALPAERLQEMVAAYYRARGWTTAGFVPPDAVGTLGLEDLLSAPAEAP